MDDQFTTTTSVVGPIHVFGSMHPDSPNTMRSSGYGTPYGKADGNTYPSWFPRFRWEDHDAEREALIKELRRRNFLRVELESVLMIPEAQRESSHSPRASPSPSYSHSHSSAFHLLEQALSWSHVEFLLALNTNYFGSSDVSLIYLFSAKQGFTSVRRKTIFRYIQQLQQDASQ